MNASKIKVDRVIFLHMGFTLPSGAKQRSIKSTSGSRVATASNLGTELETRRHAQRPHKSSRTDCRIGPVGPSVLYAWNRRS
jgi:hypothetical protein